MTSEIAALSERVVSRDADDLLLTLSALVKKLRAMEENPEWKSVWTFLHCHDYRYRGETYTKELLEAEQSLDRLSKEIELEIKIIFNEDDETPVASTEGEPMQTTPLDAQSPLSTQEHEAAAGKVQAGRRSRAAAATDSWTETTSAQNAFFGQHSLGEVKPYLKVGDWISFIGPGQIVSYLPVEFVREIDVLTKLGPVSKTSILEIRRK